jgi:hypothetical protein
MRRQGMAEKTPSTRHSFLGLYVRNLGANLLGFVVIAVLNAFTPLEFFRAQRDFIFAKGGWKTFFLFSPLANILVVLFQYRIQYPILRFFKHKQSDPMVVSEIREKAKRRLLNPTTQLDAIYATFFSGATNRRGGYELESSKQSQGLILS